jgi:hypothetical protein
MNNLRNLKLISLLSLLVNFESYTNNTAQLTDAQRAQLANQPVSRQTQIIEMLNNFLNLSVDTQKPFEVWLEDLTKVMGNAEEFKKFKPILDALIKEKNARIAGIKLAQNRKLAPLFVQQILDSKPVSELSNI